MKKLTIMIAFVSLAFILAACGQEEQQESAEENDGAPPSEQPSSTEGLVFVGGFTIEGPDGSEIVVPETTVDREAVEDYANEVRPIVEDTARDLSSVVDPSARLEDETLILSVEVESIERAKEAAEDGLRQLQEIEPSEEELEPIHEQLIRAYEEALPAYENIIEAFDSDDVDVLARAVRESLPDVEQSLAEARTILQELQRAVSQPVSTGQEG